MGLDGSKFAGTDGCTVAWGPSPSTAKRHPHNPRERQLPGEGSGSFADHVWKL